MSSQQGGQKTQASRSVSSGIQSSNSPCWSEPSKSGSYVTWFLLFAVFLLHLSVLSRSSHRCLLPSHFERAGSCVPCASQSWWLQLSSCCANSQKKFLTQRLGSDLQSTGSWAANNWVQHLLVTLRSWLVSSFPLCVSACVHHIRNPHSF